LYHEDEYACHGNNDIGRQHRRKALMMHAADECCCSGPATAAVDGTRYIDMTYQLKCSANDAGQWKHYSHRAVGVLSCCCLQAVPQEIADVGAFLKKVLPPK
jgi:hypothetical protein